MNAVELNGVFFAYNQKDILRDITFTIEKGEFCGIIGPNGAGKSTLLRIIMGILRERKGIVSVMNKDRRRLKNKELARLVGFVPQETYFQLNYNVEDIISMGRYPYLEPFQTMTKQDISAVEWAIQQTDSRKLCGRPINSLSAGERQMIVIARALAQKPEILLLDEPTSHLDIQHQSAIMTLLKDLNDQGMTLIVVNHDLNLASQYCKKLILLHEGQIYRVGKPEEIIDRKTIAEVYKIETEIIIHPEKKVPQVLLK
ncbi:MAG: ABC transporter ATP-binding protein [candidate division WOR-3 bacterium]